MTIIADDDLSAIESFGLDTGEKLRYEVGSFTKLELKTDIIKNVSLTSKLDLFSNFLHNPANIDINWDLLVNMKRAYKLLTSKNMRMSKCEFHTTIKKQIIHV